MPKQSENDINFRFLRSADPKIQRIVLNAGQSAVYEYGSQTWKRLGIEGTLFVVERSELPKFKIMIPNKLNSPNAVDIFQEVITDAFEVSIELPYVLCKNSKNEINCFWFYTKENGEIFAETISGHVKQLKEEQQDTTSSMVNKLAKFSLNNSSSQSASPKPTAVASGGTVPKMLNLADLENSLIAGDDPKPNGKPQVNHFNLLENAARSQVMAGLNGMKQMNIQDMIGQNGHNNKSSVAASEHPFLNMNGVTDASQLEMKMMGLMPEKFEPVVPACVSEKKLDQSFMSVEALEQQLMGTSASPARFEPAIFAQIPAAGTAPALVPQLSPSAMPQQQQPAISVEKLKQTMVWLLQNDADFLFKVYQTYQSKFA